MTRELYYKKADAMIAAHAHIRHYGGFLKGARADGHTKFDFESPEMQRMCWSGEINAVQAYGCRAAHDGLFAWWED